MIKFSLQRSISLAYAGLLFTAAITTVASAEEAEAVIRLKANPTGVVRVSSTSTGVVARGQSPEQVLQPANCEQNTAQSGPQQNCPQQEVYYECEEGCRRHGLLGGLLGRHHSCPDDSDSPLGYRLRGDCQSKLAWARCKFGYFIPTGSCGQGTPPFGHYSMVYPVNPQHFDGRDGQVYAAQGYAGPVAVPIAPIVHHTYNYGWGMPSSRLTPISHPVSPAQARAYQNNYQVPGIPAR